MSDNWDWLTLTPERIKATRLGLGLTQVQFGAYLGREGRCLPATKMTVSRWERGERRPARHWGPVLVKVERKVRDDDTRRANSA